MTEYKIGTATVRVHGEKPKELKDITETFVKRVNKCRQAKVESKNTY